MFSVQWWWAGLLLPLPIFVRLVLSARSNHEVALTVPFLHDQALPELTYKMQTFTGRQLCIWMVWILFLFAACRPVWITEPMTENVSGRDLMLAVDISGSMQERDMILNSRQVSRIESLKSTMDEFIGRRDGDRLGLILFGTQAYTYVPLTFDRKTLNQLLQDASIGLAGRGTAIGDAIGLAVKRMRKRQAQDKVLVLITDGSNTSGVTDPLEAAQIAVQAGLKIYTIGVGADARTMRTQFGINLVRPGSALDEAMLKQIAGITGGEYFRAKNVEALEQIYTQLDQLVPIEVEQRTYRSHKELFYIPLGISLVLLSSLLVAMSWRDAFLQHRQDV